MNECQGCSSEKTCSFKHAGPYCPCSTCLVKSKCNYLCKRVLEFLSFEAERQTKHWNIKKYENKIS